MEDARALARLVRWKPIAGLVAGADGAPPRDGGNWIDPLAELQRLADTAIIDSIMPTSACLK